MAKLHNAMLENGISSKLVYTEWDDSIAAPRASIKLSVLRGNPFFFGWNVVSRVQRAIRQADVVHVHGLYTYLNFVAGHYCRRHKKALFYHPHGSLAPVFLKSGRLKKGLVLWAFERRNFKEVTAWRALTDVEAEQIRDFVPGAKVIIVPNGVTLPKNISRVTGYHPRLELTADRKKRIFLYLSRLSVIKGLDLLLDAWQGSARQLQNCVLWIAGADRDGTEQSLRKRIRDCHMKNVCLIGPVSDDEKQWLLRASDVFVLLSRGEGQSPAVLEAMAYGKPVLLSKTCYFPDAISTISGYECSDSVPHVIEQLSRFASFPDEELEAMGRRGRALAAEKHDISKVARTLDLLSGLELDRI